MPGRVYALLFFTCLAAYALTFHGNSWNSTTRFALTMSIVRSGTVTIDEFAAITGDKAEALGHFVSDKAPGMSLLAVPPTFIADNVRAALGGNPELVRYRVGDEVAWQIPNATFYRLLWIATIATSGLISAFAVLAFCDTLIRLNVAPGTALGFAFVFGLGTMQWGWSTAFFGHAAAGAFLVLALWAIVRMTEPDGHARFAAAGGAGFFVGMAVLTEFPTAIAGALLGLFALWRLARNAARSIASAAGIAVVGAASPLLVLAAYNETAFGDPFNLSYASVVGFEGMRTGIFGVGAPRLDVLYEIILGGSRGIVWLMPIVLIFPAALIVTWKRLPDIAILSAAIVASFFLINAGYVYWDGGWSTGPRHVVPAVPFIVLPIALAYAYLPRWVRALVVGLAVLGGLANLVAVTTDMFTHNEGVAGIVLFTWLMPMFLSGVHPGVVFQPLIATRFAALGLYVAVVGALAVATFLSLRSTGAKSR